MCESPKRNSLSPDQPPGSIKKKKKSNRAAGPALSRG